MKTRKTSLCICGCGRPVWARGYGAICYQRAYRAGMIPRKTAPRACAVPGCDRPYFCGGLCHTHDMRRHRHGSPDVVRQRGRPRERHSPESTCLPEMGQKEAL